MDLRTSFDDIVQVTATTIAAGFPLIWFYEHECVDDAETFDAENKELRADDARLGRSSNTCGRRLQEFTDELVRKPEAGGRKRHGREGKEGDKTAGTHGMERGAAVALNECLYLVVHLDTTMTMSA